MGEEELGRDTFKSPYQSSHDLMLFSSNQQVYKNYMGSLGGDIINSLFSLGSNIFRIESVPFCTENVQMETSFSQFELI